MPLKNVKSSRFRNINKRKMRILEQTGTTLAWLKTSATRVWFKIKTA